MRGTMVGAMAGGCGGASVEMFSRQLCEAMPVWARKREGGAEMGSKFQISPGAGVRRLHLSPLY